MYIALLTTKDGTAHLHGTVLLALCKRKHFSHALVTFHWDDAMIDAAHLLWGPWSCGGCGHDAKDTCLLLNEALGI